MASPPTDAATRVRARLASRRLDVDLRLPAHATTALVGPNGAGKSTVVGLLSGDLRPDAGTIVIAGQPVAVAPGGRHLPAHRRSIALLQQRPLLFPHLDVLDNVAFGVRARGASTRTARARAEAELDAVGATDLARRRARSLSGGQAQRVALARALATDPAVLLLDEPFAALDVAAAASMKQLLLRRLDAPDRPTALLVTHDPLDLWALADHLVCLEDGRITASGDVAALLGRPHTGFLAQLSGTNLLRGTADADGVRLGDLHIAGLWDDPPQTSDTPPEPVSATHRDVPARPGAAPGASESQRALATFDPAAVALYPDAPGGSPRNTWPATVTGLEPQGRAVRVRLRLPDGQALAADLTPQAVAALEIAPGRHLIAQVKATQVHLYRR